MSERGGGGSEGECAHVHLCTLYAHHPAMFAFAWCVSLQLPARCPLGITSGASRGSARSASVGGSSCHGAQICSHPPLQSLQRQTPRLPLAHSSAMLLGSSFVTTLARCLRQNAQWNKINTPIVKFSLSYSFAPSIPRYMSPSFVCLWRFG